MKTYVYVDGYNLYYSLLKHSQYKWLDLFSLFKNQILHPQDPTSELLRVKYYTADIKAKFASHGNQAGEAQQRYHRALESPRTGPVDVIKGYYAVSKSTPMRYKKPPDKSDKVETWKLEEKQTDVNIALDLYRDIARGNCEQVVVCTGDTDIAPALEYIRNDFPSTKIGVIFPHPPSKKRAQPKSLAKYADWVRHHITEKELAKSLFEKRVATHKKPIDKPEYW